MRIEHGRLQQTEGGREGPGLGLGESLGGRIVAAARLAAAVHMARSAEEAQARWDAQRLGIDGRARARATHATRGEGRR